MPSGEDFAGKPVHPRLCCGGAVVAGLDFLIVQRFGGLAPQARCHALGGVRTCAEFRVQGKLAISCLRSAPNPTSQSSR